MTSVPIGWFEARYAEDPDPWGFASRWYEARKYDLTVAALPDRRYRRCFEPGCSIGVLTARLAARCDYLLAADGAAAPLRQARHRVAGFPHVTVARLVLPGQWPEGPWDLVVLSEIGYYFDGADLDRLLARAAGTIETGGTLVGVHWLGPTDYPLTGDAVHERIGAHGAFEQRAGYRDERFRLDTYRRRADD